MAEGTKQKENKRGEETPLMRQYRKVKERHPNAILLFRMGDFYETFGDDAALVSRILGITLTRRANGKAADVPLAGFPYHALDTYLPRLVQAGQRVAVCEQLEDPKFARKIVKRDVVEVVTPGVSFHEQMLDPKHANYLAAVHWGPAKEKGGQRAGLAFVDATTGEFNVTEISAGELPALIQTIAPAELLFDKRERDRIRGLHLDRTLTTPQEDWCFGHDFAYETLLRHFRTHSLKGFGVDDQPLGLVAAGAVLNYLGETQKGRLPHIRRITRYESSDYIALDAQTRRNLELVASLHAGTRDGSLIQILDETLTPMGARLLRSWLVRPLRDASVIDLRLDAVDELVRARPLRASLRDELRHVGDLERLVIRVQLARASARELVTLRTTLARIPALREQLAGLRCEALDRLRHRLTPCPDVVADIESALVDNPPAALGDGTSIRTGHSAELDDLRALSRSAKQFLTRLQAEEIQRTGITSLKVGFNRVFGYYLEVTNVHRDKVPEDYIRKQTLVNAERYITPQLKEFEEKILTAEEQIARLEADLFESLRQRVAAQSAVIQENAVALSMLDALAGLSEVAERRRYVRPTVHDGRELIIKAGRHPVVEAALPAGEPFIPNDVHLDADRDQILIITGPNMAGKSVVLRQVGLIVLLAQVGSFVPAEAASIGLVDKIFTRVGASDNLAAGESTFLVEMNETANILNNATPRSLILLDEVGRGTSTFDGLSIAWAVVEYLHENRNVAARTLFATHYHELNALADRYERIRNARIQVQEHDGKVVFLRKLVEGGADHSYGIEVARMAGLPELVIARAREILQRLEAERLSVDGGEDVKSDFGREADKEGTPRSGARGDSFQLTLFEADASAARVKQELLALDPDRLTPIEALLKLAELHKLASR